MVNRYTYIFNRTLRDISFVATREREREQGCKAESAESQSRSNISLFGFALDVVLCFVFVEYRFAGIFSDSDIL